MERDCIRIFVQDISKQPVYYVLNPSIRQKYLRLSAFSSIHAGLLYILVLMYSLI
jgi:hypothetical protein